MIRGGLAALSVLLSLVVFFADGLADTTVQGPIILGPDFRVTGSRVSVVPAQEQGLEACIYVSCSPETTAGTISAGSPTLTLAAAKDFGTNPLCLGGGGSGCGIVVDGAGAAFTVGPPTGFAVASSCTSQTITATTSSGSPLVTAVSSLYGVAVGDSITSGDGDLPGGTTVSSILILDPGTNQLRLSQNATISETLSLTVVDQCDQTHYYRIASYDQNGGVGVPVTAVHTTTGPRRPSTLAFDCLVWTRPGGTAPAGYAIWTSPDNATWTFLQLANAEGSGGCSVGSAGPMWVGGQPPTSRPFWVPADPTTISGPGKADFLRTTVTSGGGTTSLTLAVPAVTAAANVFVAHDDTAGFVAWLTAVDAGGRAGHISPIVAGVGDSTMIRTAQTFPLTKSGDRIVSEGATLRPFGAGITTGVLTFLGGQGAAATLALAGNMQEGSACLPLSSITGLNKGDFIAVSQAAPGGPTQSVPYFLFAPITELQGECNPTSVKLATPAGITFTDAPHTEIFTLAGAALVGDTYSITSATPSCTGSYVVETNFTDNTSIARGLAVAWNNACSSIAVGTHTGGVVTLQTPMTGAPTWSFMVTHGGGGAGTITDGVGVAALVQKWAPLVDAGVSGVEIDGSDLAAPGILLPATGIYNIDVANFIGYNITIKNFSNSGIFGIYDYFSYNSSWGTVNLSYAAGGTPNIASYASFWSDHFTDLRLHDISVVASQSFGTLVVSGTAPHVSGFKQRGAQWGRGFKTGGVTGGNYVNIDSSNSAFDNYVFFGGLYRNSFSNFSSAYAVGVNATGIVAFDSWDRGNRFTNYRAIGASNFDILMGVTDINNVFQSGDVGTGSGFASIIAPPSDVFAQTNGCALAFATPPAVSTQQTPSCKQQSGTWTPVLYGADTAGTATYAIQTGTYTLTDRIVEAVFSIDATYSVAPDGVMAISGLPLPSSSNADLPSSCSISSANGITTVANEQNLGGTVAASGTVAALKEFGSGGVSRILGSQLPANTVLLGKCSYPIY